MSNKLIEHLQEHAILGVTSGGGGGGGPAYSTVQGNSGTANALTVSSTIIIQGSNSISTTAANGAPDTLTIDGVNLLPRDGSRSMTANFNVGGFSITNVNLVDGRDISADGILLDALVAASGLAVTSFNTRTGAVTSQTNDYTWAQINKATSSLADITTRSHTLLTDIGTNTHAQIDSHISATGIHFLETSISHTNILDRGTNTHPQIDSHIADGTIHYTVASIDHGSISGLADDDHPQYHNDARGDARYYTQSQIDDRFTASGVTNGNSHDHSGGDGAQINHTTLSNIGTNTHAQIDTHIADGTIHFTEASINHLNIQNIGTKTHEQLDAHYNAASGVHGITSFVVGTTDSQTLTNKTISGASNTLTNIDHGISLVGLLDDDHTQYALLAGRSSGQTLNGGIGAGEDLTLQSTAHSTKGQIYFGASGVWDESTARLGIGTIAPSETLDVASNNSNQILWTYAKTDTNGPWILFRKQRGTLAAPAIVGTTDDLGGLWFTGYAAGNYWNAASIRTFVDGATVGSADMPGRLIFATSPDGTASPVDRLAILANGNVGVGTSTGIGARLWVQSSTQHELLTLNQATPASYNVDLTWSSGGTGRWITSVRSTGNNDFWFYNTSRTTTDLTILNASGNVGINETAPVNKLDVDGAVVIGNSYAGVNTAPTNGLLVQGKTGIGVTTVNSGYLETPGSTTNSSAKFGTLELQSYALNNSWIGDNVYFNGSSFVARSTGFAGMWYFLGSTATLRLFNTTTAGQTLNNAVIPIYADKDAKVFFLSGGTSLPTVSGLMVNVVTSSTSHNTNNGLGLWHHSTDALGSTQIFRKGRGTTSSPAVVVSGDTTGLLAFQGFDGTAYRDTAWIQSSVDSDPGSGDMPGKLAFYTTPDGSSTAIERLTIKNNGFTGIGTTVPVNLLDVAGAEVIGSAYAGVNAAPADGLLVQGNVSIGQTTNAAPLDVNGTVRSFAASPGFFASTVPDGADFLTTTTAVGSSFGLRWNTSFASVSNVYRMRFGGTLAPTAFMISSFDASPPLLALTISTGNLGIGVATPVNKLDVEGAVAIGASYSGTSTAPTNGLIVEGGFGVGTASVTGSAKAEINNTTAGTTNAALELSNDSTGDVFIRWALAATRGYSMGIDNSDSDKLKIGTAANASSGADTATFVTFDTTGNMGLGTTSPSANSRLDITHSNTSTTIANLEVAQDSTGDAFIRWALSTTRGWSLGIDQSDSAKLKLGTAANVTSGPETGTLLTVDTAGNFGINTSTPASKLNILDDANASTLLIERYATTDWSFLDLRRSRGTLGTHGLVSDGDRIGDLIGRASNGTNWFAVAEIHLSVDGTTSASSLPTRINFKTTPSGATSSQTRMSIVSSGNVGIGTTNPSTELTVLGTISGIHFTASGNITVGGTVDGRDVSTDGSTLDTHIATTGIHYLETDISHVNIRDIGTYTHPQIDNHINDSTIHFTVASIDHGSITGLGDDDHPQYHNDARGDIRYYLKSEIDSRFTASGVTNGNSHDHSGGDGAQINHTTLSNIGTNTHAQIDTHIADSSIHFTVASIDHGSISGLGDDDHLQYLTSGRADTWLATKTTTNLTEGSNLYFTDERVDDRVAALLQPGSGIQLTYDDSGNILTITVTGITGGVNNHGDLTGLLDDDHTQYLLADGTRTAQLLNVTTTVTTSGLVASGINVGFPGPHAFGNMAVGDANFNLSLPTATTPRVTFDSGDYLDYDRTFNRYRYFVGGAEKARISSNGQLSLNNTNSNYQLQVFTDSAAGTAGVASFAGFGADNYVEQIFYRGNGSVASPTNAANNNQLGAIVFTANISGSAYRAAKIAGWADGVPAANDVPGRLTFHTSNDGTQDLRERMRITSTGDVRVAHKLSTLSGIDLTFARDTTDIAKITTSGFAPVTSGIYDLGSPTVPWRHLYVTSGTVFLGETELKSTPAGVLQLSGGLSVAGDLDLSGYNITNAGIIDGADIAQLQSDFTTHSGDQTIHFTQSQIDHGTVSGLADDDHTQYHTDARALTWLNAQSIDALSDVVISSPVSGQALLYNGTSWVNDSASAATDHGTLGGLADDDHTQYALLAGRSGGQTLTGGTGSAEQLYLSTTAHATKGKILFGDGSVWNEANDFWGLGQSNPANKLEVAGALVVGGSYTGSTSLQANGITSQGRIHTGIQSSSPFRLYGVALGSIDTAALVLTHYNTADTAAASWLFHANTGISSGYSTGFSTDNTATYMYINTTSRGIGFNTGAAAFPNTGTTRLFISGPGNVGIGGGVTSSGSLLGVNGAATIGSTYYSLVAPTNGLLVQGAVGIGTTSTASFLLNTGGSIGPVAANAYTLGSLSLYWNALYSNNATLLNGLSVGHTGTPGTDMVSVGDGNFSLQLSAAVPYINFDTATTDRIYYNRTGNEYHFQIAGADNAVLTSNGLQVGAGLVVGFVGTPSIDEVQVGDANFKLDYYTTSGVLQFDTGDSFYYDRTFNHFYWTIAGLERAKLTASGDFGIGVNPTERLHVYETFNAATGGLFQNPNTGSSASCFVQVSSDAADLVIQAVSSNNTTSLAGSSSADKAVIYSSTNTSGGLFIGTHAGAPLGLTTSGIERARITELGLVGIGTTNPTHQLTVQGTVSGIDGLYSGSLLVNRISSSGQTARFDVWELTNRAITTNNWVDISANGGGAALIGSNCYTNNNDNTIRYSNTHGSIGAAGMTINGIGGWGTIAFFVNSGATTAGNTFTPTAKFYMTANVVSGVIPLSFNTGTTAYPIEGLCDASGYAAFFRNGTTNNLNRQGIRIQCGETSSAGTQYPVRAFSNDGSEIGGLWNNAGTFSTYDISDQNRKTDITSSLIDANSIIKNIQVVEYRYKDGNNNKGKKHTAGFLAQNLEALYPDAVFTTPDGNKATSRTALIPVLVKALQEQQKTIEQLMARIEALENP